MSIRYCERHDEYYEPQGACVDCLKEDAKEREAAIRQAKEELRRRINEGTSSKLHDFEHKNDVVPRTLYHQSQREAELVEALEGAPDPWVFDPNKGDDPDEDAYCRYCAMNMTKGHNKGCWELQRETLLARYRK